MIKLILYITLAFSLQLSADIIKHKVNNSNPTPVIREPLPNRIKRVIHRLPRRPMLEHRRLYRRLGILPEIMEYCYIRKRKLRTIFSRAKGNAAIAEADNLFDNIYYEERYEERIN